MRLLRPYNEDEIQSKVDMSSSKGKGKRGEVTDQFVELPLEQRIYDLIESEGSKGITISEVSKSLSLPNTAVQKCYSFYFVETIPSRKSNILYSPLKWELSCTPFIPQGDK